MRPNGLLVHRRLRGMDMSATTASLPVPYVTAERPAINPWIIAVTVTLATFMELLDTAIANVALPHIAGGLAVSYDESTWVLTSYLVSNAVVLPLSAWLSRVFGRKRYYMLCVVLFTLCSPRCRRRRPRSGRASHSRRHVPSTEATRGLRALQHGYRDCPGDRPSARRVDHRQLELAVDFFYQHSDRNSVSNPDEAARFGSS